MAMAADRDTAYRREKAERYEEQSRFDKGSRELHRHYLIDTIGHLLPAPASFLDLGCGTGYFAEAIFAAFPGIRGTLVDGSAQMLDLARDRLRANAGEVEYRCRLLQDLGDDEMGGPDLVFSSLAVHFLDDADKWALFARIHRVLPQGGLFILFDQFEPEESRWSSLLEYLACKDLKRRVEAELQLDFEMDELRIDRLLEKARGIKIEDREKDASLPDHFHHLKAAGFESACLLFQETRFFGLIAIK